MELMDREELQKLRLVKLQKQLEYVYTKSEFYKTRFDDVGVHPKDIKNMETFRKLPIFLDKETHRKIQEESMKKEGHGLGTFVCTTMDKIKLVCSTSGTTGAVTYYLFTKKDLDIQARLNRRQMKVVGFGHGDVLLHGAAMSGLYMAGAPNIYYYLTSDVGTLIPLGGEAGAKKLLETALATRATVLKATPSYLKYISEVADQIIGKPVSELGIRKLICIGEPGAGLPEVRKVLSERFRAEIYDSIGPGTNFAAVSCPGVAYQGMHVVSEDYMIHDDLVDPVTKKPMEIKDGVIGEQVRTALEREAGPFIRYSVGDLIQVFTEPCPSCGIPGQRIKVVGRVDDMLIVKGINVWPTGIKNVLASFIPQVTGEFKIVLTEAPPRVIPPLKLKVETGPEMQGEKIENLMESIGQTMHNLLRIRPKIEMLPIGTLQRTSKKNDWFERVYKS